jgi:hypothetical protein
VILKVTYLTVLNDLTDFVTFSFLIGNLVLIQKISIRFNTSDIVRKLNCFRKTVLNIKTTLDQLSVVQLFSETKY